MLCDPLFMSQPESNIPFYGAARLYLDIENSLLDIGSSIFIKASYLRHFKNCGLYLFYKHGTPTVFSYFAK